MSEALPDGVETVEAFRVCSHGSGTAFRARLESTGPAAVQALLSAAERRGAILNTAQTLEAARDFAQGAGTWRTCHVLDLVNSNGDILDDRLIPADTWTWWCAAAGLQPVSGGCPDCESAAHQWNHPRPGRPRA